MKDYRFCNGRLFKSTGTTYYNGEILEFDTLEEAVSYLEENEIEFENKEEVVSDE